MNLFHPLFTDFTFILPGKSNFWQMKCKQINDIFPHMGICMIFREVFQGEETKHGGW